MYEKSGETQARVLTRDREERAGMGGVDGWVSGEVVGIPTGATHTSWPGEKRGPLDGQPAHNWEYRATYASGRVVTFKGMDRVR